MPTHPPQKKNKKTTTTTTTKHTTPPTMTDKDRRLQIYDFRCITRRNRGTPLQSHDWYTARCYM
jgi:hypothetical protein